MDMFNMMQAMQNPQMYAMQQMMNTMIQQNPQQWQQAQQMFAALNARMPRPPPFPMASGF